MFGVGIIFLAGIIAVSNVVVYAGGPVVPKLLSDMPTFYQYDEETGEQLQDEDGNPIPNEKTELYRLLSTGAVIVFVFVAIGAIAVWLVEDAGIARKGIAFDVLSKIVLYLVILLPLPLAWDMFAITIQSSSLYLMDPFGTGSPSEKTAKLWQGIGATVPPDALDLDSWSQALSSPGEFGQAIVKNVFMALFKAFAVLFMTAMMFVLSVIRIELTMIIVISMPIILAVRLIPMFSSVSDMLLKNLAGLCIAPIFSALVLTVGMAYLEAEQLSAIEDWFATLAIGFLAIFFPVMLAPMLGFLSTQVGQTVSTAMQGMTMMGGGMTAGVMSGLSLASAGMEGAAGKAAGAAAGSGNTMSSEETNSLTSGNNIGFMDKMKVYGKAATAGAAGGLAGGAIQSVSSQARMPGLGKEASNSINREIASKGLSIGQDAMVDSTVKNMAQSFAEHSPPDLPEEAYSTERFSTHMGTTSRMMSAPGGMLNSMTDNSGSFDAGQNIMSNPHTQQEFLHHQQQKVRGFDSLPADKQARFNDGIMNQVKQNPDAAGHMLEGFRNSGDGSKNSLHA